MKTWDGIGTLKIEKVKEFFSGVFLYVLLWLKSA